jgi:hypothetical protein
MGGALRLVSLRELAGPGLDATSCGTLAEVSKSAGRDYPLLNPRILNEALRGSETVASFSCAIPET